MLTFVFVGVSDGFLIGYKASLIFIFTERKVPSIERAILNAVLTMYVLRMFVAPITDKYFFPFLGKRKTYLIPCKLIMAFLYGAASLSIEGWVEDNNIMIISAFFFVLNVIMLFEYNALTGFRLDYFGQSNASSAASSNTIGIFLGLICGLQVFTALNSKKVCQKYFGREEILLSHQDFFIYVALHYLLSTLVISFMSEKKVLHHEKVNTIPPWRTIKCLFRVPTLKKFMLWNFFGPSLAFAMKVTAPQYYIDGGINREDIVILVAMITMPISILSNVAWIKVTKGGRLMFLFWLAILNAVIFESFNALNHYNFKKEINYQQTLVFICLITSLDALANWFMIQGTIIMTSSPKKYTLTYIASINSLTIAMRAIPVGTISAMIDYVSMSVLFPICLIVQIFFNILTFETVKDIDKTDPKLLGAQFLKELEQSEDK